MEDQLGHFAISHEHAGVDALAGLGALEQVADHDGRLGKIPVAHGRAGVGALTRAGRTVEPENFLGKTKFFGRQFLLKLAPDTVKNNLGILDFEVADRSCALGLRGGGVVLRVSGHNPSLVKKQAAL